MKFMEDADSGKIETSSKGELFPLRSLPDRQFVVQHVKSIDDAWNGSVFEERIGEQQIRMRGFFACLAFIYGIAWLEGDAHPNPGGGGGTSEYSYDFRNIDNPDEEMYVTCEKITRNYKHSKAQSQDFWEIRQYCDWTNHRLPGGITNSYVVTVKYDRTEERAVYRFFAPFPKPELESETGDMLTRTNADHFWGPLGPIAETSPARLDYINTDLKLAVLDYTEYRPPDKQDSANGFRIYIDLNHINNPRYDKWSDIFAELSRNELESYSIFGPKRSLGKIRNRRGTIINDYSDRFQVDLMKTIFQGLPRGVGGDGSKFVSPPLDFNIIIQPPGSPIGIEIPVELPPVELP